MSDLKACRVCLRTKCKMYKCNRFQLKLFYEEITSFPISIYDGMPHYFCYECAASLNKYHKFKSKCSASHQLMVDMIRKKGGVTYKSIENIQNICPALKSTLGIVAPSKRVKTYSKNHDTKKLSKRKIARKKVKEYDSEMENMEIEVKTMSPFNENNDSHDYNDDFFTPVNDDPVVSKSDIEMNNGEEKNNLITIPTNVLTAEESDIKAKTVEFATEQKIDGETFIEEEKPLEPEEPFAPSDSEDECIAKVAKKKQKEKEISSSDEKEKDPSSTPTKKLNPNARPAFTKQRKRFLDPQHWKQYTLSPEDAKQQFYGKAFDEKYLQSSYKCTDCLKGFSKEDIWQRHRVLLHAVTKGRHECHFCHLRFKIDSHLRRHLRLHFTRYQCLRCQMVFNNQEIALLHDDNHSGTKKFKCSICEHEFKHQSTYYTHMRTVHRSEFVCTLCGAAFVSQLGLRKHTKIKHCLNDEKSNTKSDGESATFCDLCNITFETRAAYEFHKHNSALHGNDMKGSNGIRKREFKSRPGKKPTSCMQCGQQFATQSACLQHHQRAHPGTPFDPQRHVCEICGASLAPGSLAMHQNIHSRENLYPCETCGKTFYSKAGLQRHHVTHTGEKPFACTLCDKRFTQNDSMKLHYRTYHLKQPYPKRNRNKKQDITEAIELKMPSDPVFYLK